MSDQQETMTPTEPIAPEPSEQSPEVAQEGPVPEAKKYRLRAQEAESERDQLRGRVDRIERGEALRLAGALERPDDLFDVLGADLAQLRDDDGHLDGEKVTALLETAKTDRGYLFTANRRKDVNLGQGRGRGGMAATTSWAEALESR